MTDPSLLKRKHVVFAEGQADSPDASASAQSSGRAAAANGTNGSNIHPSRLATVPGLEVTRKPKNKSDKKKRYLIKKAKKHRKLVSAKKAAAPKNKNWKEGDPEDERDIGGSDSDGSGDESEEEESTKKEEEEEVTAPSKAKKAKIEKTKTASAVDESSKNKTEKSVAVTAVTAASPGEEEEDPVVARERRQREKREKREAKQKRKAEERKQAAKAAALKARTTEITPGISQRQSLEAVEATETTTKVTEMEDGVSESEEEQEQEDKKADEDEDEDPDMDEEVPAQQADRADSPPPLIPFPLPTPAAAPSQALLLKQGLPTGLSDAEFIDQELRVKLADLKFQRLGQLLGLTENMRKKLSDLGIEEFFAVQAALLPRLLLETLIPRRFHILQDYLVSAPTGSGKTLAYAVPLIEVLAPRVVTRLRALIVLPTRDLVVQVRETLEILAKGTGLVIGSISGQHSFAHEQRMLIARPDQSLLGGSSKVDILVATPGRLVDHINSTKNFTLQHLRFLIIDEADRLLNQSFQDWLANILSHIEPPLNAKLPEGYMPFDHLAPHWAEAYGVIERDPIMDPPAENFCQKLLFSATLTRDPSKVSALNLRSPKYFIIQSSSQTALPQALGATFALPETLTEKMIILPPSLKPLNLIHLIHGDKSIRSVLVFTKSVEAAIRLTKLLQFFEDAWMGEGKMVVKGYGRDLKPGERKGILADFAAGKINLLVCSDLISRGIDLPTVENVVSYDIPLDMRKYVHRVGRTARAGRSGTAWTLVEKQEAIHFKSLLKGANHESKVKKIKIKEDELAPYRESYEIALKRLKDLYSRDD